MAFVFVLWEGKRSFFSVLLSQNQYLANFPFSLRGSHPQLYLPPKRMLASFSFLLFDFAVGMYFVNFFSSDKSDVNPAALRDHKWNLWFVCTDI